MTLVCRRVARRSTSNRRRHRRKLNQWQKNGGQKNKKNCSSHFFALHFFAIFFVSPSLHFRCRLLTAVITNQARSCCVWATSLGSHMYLRPFAAHGPRFAFGMLPIIGPAEYHLQLAEGRRRVSWTFALLCWSRCGHCCPDQCWVRRVAGRFRRSRRWRRRDTRPRQQQSPTFPVLRAIDRHLHRSPIGPLSSHIGASSAALMFFLSRSAPPRSILLETARTLAALGD